MNLVYRKRFVFFVIDYYRMNNNEESMEGQLRSLKGVRSRIKPQETTVITICCR